MIKYFLDDIIKITNNNSSITIYSLFIVCDERQGQTLQWALMMN